MQPTQQNDDAARAAYEQDAQRSGAGTPARAWDDLSDGEKRQWRDRAEQSGQR